MKFNGSNTGHNVRAQPADLQAQNISLRRQLDELMSEARRNERKLRRFEALELRLIGIASLNELIKALVHPDTAGFSWDLVTLVLVDSDHEVRRMVEDTSVKTSGPANLVLVDSLADLDAIYPHSLFATLGAYRASKHARLFPRAENRPQSVALLPLIRYGKLIGSLNIGSFNEERFAKGSRTDFFEHFAAIVAICIENLLNIYRLKRQGLTDTLTAVNNRRFFDQRLREEVEVVKRSKEPLSCMMLDVDHFKHINDSYGHQAGDYVLRELAAIIRAQLRGSDVLARYGGEEFAVLLAKTPLDVAQEIAERIRRSVAEFRFVLANGLSFQVTLSAGIAALEPAYAGVDPQVNSDWMIGHSDLCLYDAKRCGRNRVQSRLVTGEPESMAQCA